MVKKIFLYLFLFSALWFFSEKVLDCRRGLDLSDEGIHLLCADPPQKHATWDYYFPFGWHTNFLFQLVNYDIAAFRTLGAVILIFLGGWFGNVSVRTMSSFANLEKRKIRYLGVCGALIGGMSVLLLNASLVRTPNYNWVNLVGMILAAGGFFKLAHFLEKEQINKWQKGFWWPVFLTSFGIFVSIPAKPSTSGLVFFSGILYLIFLKNGKKTLLISFGILVALIFWIFAACLTGFWDWPFIQYFTMPLKGPRLSAEHSLIGALKQLALSPNFFFQDLWKLKNAVLLFVGLAFLIIPFAKLRYRKEKIEPSIMLIFGLIMISGLCLYISSSGPGFLFTKTPVWREGFAHTSTACLLLLVWIYLWFFQKSEQKENQNFTKSKLEKTICFLTFLPFVFAFGHAHGIYRNTPMAMIFVLLAAMVAPILILKTKTQKIGAGVLVIFVFLLVLQTILDSRRLPYRMASMDQQTEPIKIGQHGCEIKLDPTLAHQLRTIRKQAENSGWSEGMPLLEVIWSWSSGIPYFLGAKVPNCMLLTIFGYPGSVDLARFKIKSGLNDFPAAQSWILTSCPTKLEPKAAAEIQEVIEELSKVTQKSFPRDYDLVAEAEAIQLWKPKSF